MDKITEVKSPFPPGEHLSESARELYSRLQNEYGIWDCGGATILQCACEAFDRCRSAREEIEADGGPVILDRFGQKKPHPAIGIERDSRSQLLVSLKNLNLDIEPIRSAPGRPTSPLGWAGGIK